MFGFSAGWSNGGPRAWQAFLQRRARAHVARQRRNMSKAAEAARAAGSAASRVRTGRLRSSWRIRSLGDGLAVSAVFYSKANPANRPAGAAARRAADQALRGSGMSRSGSSSVFK